MTESMLHPARARGARPGMGLLAALLLFPPGSLTSQPADTAWPMLGHDARRTARSPYVGPEIPELQWRYVVEGHIWSSPVIGAHGTLYLGSTHGLYAVRPDGTLEWGFALTKGVGGTPALGGDGTVYAGSGDGAVYAVSPLGSLRWKHQTGGQIVSSPAIGADGTVYVGSWDAHLYALSPGGAARWRYETGAAIHASPAVGMDGTVYVLSWDGVLHALYPDGQLRWTHGPGYYRASSPAIADDGTIYVGSGGGMISALTPQGELVWRSGTEAERVEDMFLAMGREGTVYVSSYYHYGRSGAVRGQFAVLRPDGSVKWRWETDTEDAFFTAPTIDSDGTIYLGAYIAGKDYLQYALRPDFSTAWTYPVGFGYVAAPVIGRDGTLYVLGGNTLYAIGSSHTAVWERSPPPLPGEFALSQNVPNPFNSSTVIEFALPALGDVDLAVYNLAGQRVATLVAGPRQAGVSAARWGGRDDSGRGLATGAYLYRLQVGGRSLTRRLLLVR